MKMLGVKDVKGVISDLFEKLAGENCGEWLTELKKFLRKEPCWTEMLGNLIVRHVSVNRSRSAQEAIDATGRNKYLDDNVVATMPQGEGDEADVFFFKLARIASDEEVEKEYELRGYKPADPYALAAVNEADPSFADEHPNCTHWKDANGNWCYVAFNRWNDERDVYVFRHDFGWSDYWWFAGRRK